MKEESKTALVKFAIIAFVVFIFYGAFIQEDDYEKQKRIDKEKADKNKSKLQDLYFSSQTIVEQYLISPTTAEFPAFNTVTVSKLPDESYSVTAYVDSKNRLGVPIRSQYFAILKQQNSQYLCTQLVIDNKQIIGDMFKTTPTISYAQYSQLYSGMTYAECKRIIGAEGEVIAHNTTKDYFVMSVKWQNNDGSNAIITFLNNKAETIAQFGLK